MSILRRTAPRLFRNLSMTSVGRSLAFVLLGLIAFAGVGFGDDPPASPDDQVAAETKAEEPKSEEPAAADQPESEADATPDAEPGPVTALVHGRIFTMADAGQIADGTVLIQDGKIVAVGTDLEIPAGANVIDVTGMTVTPGLVDLRSKLWLTSGAGSDSGTTAALSAVDGVDAYSSDWKEVARQGITSVYVQPAARGSLGGYGALLRVAAGDSAAEADLMEKLVLAEKAGFQSSLGVATSNSSTKAQLAEFTGLKKRLSDAKEYAEKWEKYREYGAAEAKKKAEKDKQADKEKAAEKSKKEDAKEGEKEEKKEPSAEGGSPNRGRSGMRRPGGSASPEAKPETESESGDYKSKKSDSADEASDKDKKEEPPKKPDVDPLKDRLVEVLEGKLPLRLEVHGLEDCRRALELAKEFELTVVLEGLSDMAGSTEDVVDSTLPIVLGPWLDTERESYQAKDRVELWGDALTEYPGRFAIASFGRTGRASKDLRYHAAAAVSAGFDAERVLQAITSTPALLAGAGATHGKLKAGFAADIAVFAGHPLDPSSPVAMTFSAGERTFDAGAVVAGEGDDVLVTEVDVPESLPSDYAIKSTRILGEDGTFAPGVLKVSKGKIVGLFAADESTEETTLIDVGDAAITPGLVSAHAELTLASLVDRQGLSDSGPVRAADVYDGLLPVVRRLVEGGFLRAVTVPASDRVIAGQAAEIRLLAKQPIVNAELAEKVVLSGAARSRERFPSSLAGQQQLVRDTFSGNVQPSPMYLPAAALAVFDAARSERQNAITGGERAVMLLVETDAEVAAASKLIKELGFRGILTAAEQWEPVVTMLREADDDELKVSCIVRTMTTNDYDWYAEDIAGLVDAGAKIAFAGEDAMLIRKTAAAAVQAGLPKDAALRALTSDAAEITGMSAGAGRLTADTDADFVIWNGSPLNLAAIPVAIVVDGSLVEKQ